jgi:predicted transcriptional regulator
MSRIRPKKNSEQIPSFEIAIIHVLWDRGACTVRQVMQALPGDPAYTMVQTILNIMTRKRRTNRLLKGRAHIYRANIEREIVQKAELASVLKRVFRGYTEDLRKALLSTTSCNDRN